MKQAKTVTLRRVLELTATDLTVVGEGAKINDKTTWTTRTPGSGLADEAGNVYWAWDMDGGQTVYMPTFNKNKDSLKSDVNGTYDGTAPNDKDTHYDDYKTYTMGDSFSDKRSMTRTATTWKMKMLTVQPNPTPQSRPSTARSSPWPSG